MKKYLFNIIVIILLIISFVLHIINYNGYKHLKRDIKIVNSKITLLEKDNLVFHNIHEQLELKYDQLVNYYNYQTEYSDDAFNYFAIGNSLTFIPGINRGISATKPDNDYFNIIVKFLQRENSKVVAYPFNFAAWERSANRNKTLSLIDVYLDKKLDLVSIQLGENVFDYSNYEKDLEKLISYIRNKCPNAKIVVIGDFWNKEHNEFRKIAAKNMNVSFVDISEIIGDKKYQSVEGTICYNKDGSTFKVSKEAETHPGDEGMKFIANKFIQILKQ